ncbi:MAG: PEP-CTERM sorting domain-containing protein [Burkholderiales bacterium]|nr:PEP-CTERM sorting domain-containing protein [Burkholderiales bacterium]
MRTSFVKHTLGMAALALAGQAYAVVETGHWGVLSSSSFGNFAVNVDQTVGADLTTVFMNYTSGQLSGVTYTVDEGAQMYLVQPGDVFTQASSALATNVFGTTPITVGTDFYLAAKTRSFSDPGFSWDTYTSFGWAHFKVDGSGTPQLLESAMAFRENGIVVGTLTVPAVPEPSTVALMMEAGLAGLAWRLWSRRPARRTAL